MRRLTLLLAGGAVWLFLAAIPVFADGGPHIAALNSGTSGLTADSCAGCHRAHTAQGPLLLNAADTEALCFTCHGSSGLGATTDVQGGVQYALGSPNVRGTAVVGALRNGGFVSTHIWTSQGARLAYQADPTHVRQRPLVAATSGATAVTSTHLNNAGTGIAWGNGPISATADLGATVTIECTTCHNPHGNGNYRILNPLPVPAAVVSGTWSTGTAVYVTDAALPPAGDTRNYTIHQTKSGSTNGMLLLSQAQVGTTSWSGDYFHRVVPWDATTGGTYQLDAPNGNPTTFDDQIDAWCATCHQRLLASTGTPYATDSGDAVFKYRHGTNVSGRGTACTTCHVAHGTSAAMTGPYSSNFSVSPVIASSTGADSFLLKVDNRGTCQECHDPTGTITAGTYIGPLPTPATP